MERKIRLLLEYDGTRYHGWQRQANTDMTIQARLEEAIERLSGEAVTVIGAGRTDAGVHARGQVVTFALRKALPLYNVQMGLNHHLPRDIVVRRAEACADAFDARFSARRRIYHYTIATERTALMRRYCWQVYFPFDAERLDAAAAMLAGRRDFGAFCRVEVASRTKICHVVESAWRREGSRLIYRVAADRFLHGMVRTLVGTMMDVARGRTPLDEFAAIIESTDRTRAGAAAPARGLVLEEVLYDGDPGVTR